METEIYFEVIEYSNKGYGKLDIVFPAFDSAVDWVDKAQSSADSKGNPEELCYSVVPSSIPLYDTVSKVFSIKAAA